MSDLLLIGCAEWRQLRPGGGGHLHTLPGASPLWVLRAVLSSSPAIPSTAWATAGVDPLQHGLSALDSRASAILLGAPSYRGFSHFSLHSRLPSLDSGLSIIMLFSMAVLLF